uniref:CD4-4a protein n=1 Tax=Tetraodon nigroviridis TaxID=99883 RepID=B5KH14_TETNG|nr:CD4-4a protein [Tetraodon nigroviridis]
MEKFRSALLLLLLSALVSASRAQEVTYAEVGQPVSLTCPKTQSWGHLEWLFGGRELAWRNHMGGQKVNTDGNWKELALSPDGSLTVNYIRPEQFGIYVCKVSESGSSGTGTEKAVSYKVLRLTVSAEPSLVLSGQTVTLVCEAPHPSSRQTPEIHWLDPQGEEVKRGNGEVKVSGRHSGQWTCMVTLGQRTHRAHVSVTVVDLDSPPLQYTSKSSPLSIPCSIPAHVSWEQIKALGLQEGHWHFFPRSASDLLSSEAQRLFSLSLDPVAWQSDQTRGLSSSPDLKNRNLSLGRRKGDDGDRGDYVCSLKFDNGLTLSRTVRVDVLEIVSAPGTDLISGQQLNLSCSLGVPLTSDLRPRWIPPEGSSLQRPLSGRLAIPAVSAGDGGKWRCELRRNDTLLTSAVITLKIESRLTVWMLVIICSAAVIVFLLLLLGFLCRHRRAQKMRHMRHRLCQCKNPKPKGFYRT